MGKVKTEIKWAIIFTLAGLAWMLMEKMTGLHDKHIDKHNVYTNFYAFIAILLMVLALRDKKRNFYLGKITYLQGFKSGVILSFFIALLAPFAQWVTSFVISPDFFENVVQYAVEKQYYDTSEEAEAYFNFENYAVQSAIGAIIMGTLTTAVAMIFIRSKKSKGNEN